jgi:hypothetical protein
MATRKVTRLQLPESKDMGMGILCEFIEDCEYPNLSASVLHILGQHGPSSATPSKFVKLPLIVQHALFALPPTSRSLRWLIQLSGI